MGRKQHTTKFIQDESQIPDGYVPLASFGHNTSIHRALCDAHRSGSVRAVKLVRHEGDIKTGAVWVHAADAAEFQQSYGVPKQPGSAVSRAKRPGDVDASESLSLVCGQLLEELRRIADAVEVIATQPDKDEEEKSFSSNGFHG